MSTEDLQKRTTVNIQEKANLIWPIADKLVGTYKPHEYGNVILPMCVIKHFSDTVAPTKEAVLKANVLIKGGDAENMRHGNTPSDEIFAHLQELERQETALMAKIMGR